MVQTKRKGWLRRALFALVAVFSLLLLLETPASAQDEAVVSTEVAVDSVVVALYVGALALTASKATSLVKYVSAGDWNSVVTTLTAALIGVGLILLGSSASGFQHLPVADGTPLTDLNGGAIVLWGIVFGFTGSFAYDWRKARDNSDSAAEPKLMSSARRRAG